MQGVKERLVLSGLTSRELSQKSGLSIERIEAVLAGGALSLAELSALAKALGIKPSEFAKHSDQATRTELLFRQSAPRATKSFDSVRRISDQLATCLEFATPLFHKLEWLESFKPAAETYDEAEFLAERFRALYFGEDLVSPMFGLPKLVAEGLGVLLFVVPEQGIEGASAIVGGRAFIFLSPRTFKPRMLFTLAHELGHLVAGHLRGSEVACIDEADSLGTLSRSRAKSERFADAFASALLLPAKGVGIALSKLRTILKTTGNLGDVEILYLSRIFGVSFEVAARRCEDLQLVPLGGARSLYEWLVKEHGSPEKRADSLGLPARPDIEFRNVPSELIDVAIDKVRRGELSIGKASSMLRMTIPQFYDYNANTLH
ncbi:ImmA/IrrE family metallo-endopeptidase [Burkholderia sp. S-53]|uniref:ImmA/IrrE family metallo-endopeptidase n=1 Tax=Burkholderia sp. S-53 TaxID=2906514 RepID=UPI0021D3185E|nr:XRE family transcriptional regulator [Burkholderia sp. S-53]UXU92095.1 XRE family transcriptional regulator [Burkholderia sp. S-53]